MKAPPGALCDSDSPHAFNRVMQDRYDYYWLHHSTRALRGAVIVSLILHAGILAGLTWLFTSHKPKIHPSVYQVQFLAAGNPSEPEAVVPEPPPPPEPEPKAEPPPPPPKEEAPKPKPPEPKKEEKPKPPEKPKPKEKPKPPEPPKEKPKPQPPKEKPKPEPPKEQPKPAPEPAAKPGVSMKQALPTVLGTWGGLVQRKVERAWDVPVGVRIDPENNEAVVSFWVNRDGRLLGEPEILKQALDPAIGQSAIDAVKAAAPFPPLPDGYNQPEVQVVYTFIPEW